METLWWMDEVEVGMLEEIGSEGSWQWLSSDVENRQVFPSLRWGFYAWLDVQGKPCEYWMIIVNTEKEKEKELTFMGVMMKNGWSAVATPGWLRQATDEGGILNIEAKPLKGTPHPLSLYLECWREFTHTSFTRLPVGLL